jgi:hypothetical protein
MHAMVNRLDSTVFDIEIIKPLAVGPNRCCQVVVLRIVERVRQDLNPVFIAKIYDPLFCPEVDSKEWPGGQREFIASLGNIEAKAYQKLQRLQGKHILNYYDQYKYHIPDHVHSEFNSVDVILLE